jgi:hypothetical protein
MEEHRITEMAQNLFLKGKKEAPNGERTTRLS